MKPHKKILSFLILSALTFLLAGCSDFQETLNIGPKTDSTRQQTNDVSKRFQDTAPIGQTAVDSALELSKKNTELFEKMTTQQQEILQLTAENRQLKEQVAVLDPELKQARKELNEANDLLIEMRIELNNWKSNILGYRQEMRDANTAQMEILLKIAQAMGAEIATEQETNKQPTETSTPGTPNE